MPAKKHDDDKDMESKVAAKHDDHEPTDGEKMGRSPEAPPDSGDTVMNYGPRGDAVPITHDPLLSPDAQQPGEQYEDFVARTGGKKPRDPGVFDASVTRDKAPG